MKDTIFTACLPRRQLHRNDHGFNFYTLLVTRTPETIDELEMICFEFPPMIRDIWQEDLRIGGVDAHHYITSSPVRIVGRKTSDSIRNLGELTRAFFDMQIAVPEVPRPDEGRIVTLRHPHWDYPEAESVFYEWQNLLWLEHARETSLERVPVKF